VRALAPARTSVWASYQNNLWGGVRLFRGEKKISFLEVDFNKFNCAYWGV